MARLFNFRLKDRQYEKNVTDENSENTGNEEIIGLSQLYCPEQGKAADIRDVADVLLEMGKIDEKQLSKIRAAHKKKADSDISEIIIGLKLADKNDILTAQAGIYGLEFRHIEPDDVQNEAFG
ncbi:MAG: hypothetical protein JW837_14815, partial [Sedimentisphaerales bacterium]|nr:hypothetical protein [Sedimentisphaerales bacterium]